MSKAPCDDCGVSGDWRIMQWDHLESTGRRTVGTLLKGKWETVLDEIAKCDLVCANCHAIRTHDRGQYGRQRGMVRNRS